MEIYTFEPKQPWEIVPYTFDFSRFPAIANGDYISSVAFGIYKSTDSPSSPTLITSMVYATAYDNTSVTCETGSGGDIEGTYMLRARVTTASGLRYEQQAIFTVKEI
jgi:hypothetical protein